MPKGLVDEIIDMMYEQATEELAADGIVIAKHTVEWHVDQMDDDHVRVAWKAVI